MPEPIAALVAVRLSRTFETSVSVTRVERIEPWSVARCFLEANTSDVPGTVVVKWLRDLPGDGRTEPVRLATEQAALEFVAGLDPDLVPRVVAADLEAADPRARFVVLEDLAPREPLRAVLLRDGLSAAEERLRAFGRAMARLHAASIGRSGDYYTKRSGGDPHADLVAFAGNWRDGVQHVEAAGAPMPAAAADELAAVAAELCDPGPFLAFSNGDPGVNNYLVDGTPTDGRIIDFEGAGYRHALSDLVNDLYVPGSMWITVADPIETGVEAAYRETLAETVPEVTDDRTYGRIVSGAALVFACMRLAALPRLDARAVGEPSRLQRVRTLDAAAHTAERHDALPHARGWARSATAVLRRRWPDADVDPAGLAPYSARE